MEGYYEPKKGCKDTDIKIIGNINRKQYFAGFIKKDQREYIQQRDKYQESEVDGIIKRTEQAQGNDSLAC